jgi:hypothetical protein
VITYAGCTAPNQGTCSPDLNPDFAGSPRINGKFGKGITAANLTAISYINAAAFQAPNNFTPEGGGAGITPINKIGTAPRSAPYGLQNQATYHLDLSLRRNFNLTRERESSSSLKPTASMSRIIPFSATSTRHSALRHSVP